MFTSLEKLSACFPNLLYRDIEITFDQDKTEVSDSSAASGNAGGIGVLVKRDHVLTSGSVQKDHVVAESEGFPHAKYLLIKPERALHIPNVQMNVRQASCADHDEKIAGRLTIIKQT